MDRAAGSLRSPRPLASERAGASNCSASYSSGAEASKTVGGQHAEAGGDMIDEAQQEIRTLARELGLQVSFQRVRADRIWTRSGGTLFASGHVNVVLPPPPPAGSRLLGPLGSIEDPDERRDLVADLADDLLAPLGTGTLAERARELVRRYSAPLTHDRALHEDIARLAEAVRDGEFAGILRGSNR